MKILVFGNPLVDEDSLPLRLIPDLKKKFPEIEFKEFDSVEELQNEGRNLTIIDTVKGIDKVQIIDDIESFELNKIYSLHDFDLGYNLKLMKKAGMIDSVIILGTPIQKDEQRIFKELVILIDGIKISSEVE